MQTFYMTDAGKVRTHNEDNVTIISNNNNEFILAVAEEWEAIRLVRLHLILL